MGEFFKPWRRKIGVATLVMACVFMAVWVKSHLASELRIFRHGNKIERAVFLCPQGIWWIDSEITNETTIDDNAYRLRSASRITESGEIDPFNVVSLYGNIERHEDFFGFKFFKMEFRTRSSPPPDAVFQRTMMFAPHWLIVWPPTLLSAWLLLSKPRTSNRATSPASTTQSEPSNQL